jgi:hypothetical protein
LCEAAGAGVRKNHSYLGAQFRRFQRRFGRKAEGKAIFACAHTLIAMIWHVLAKEGAVFEDLGSDWSSVAPTPPPPTPSASSASSRSSATASPSNPRPEAPIRTTPHVGAGAPTR